MQARVLVLSNMYPSRAHPTFGGFVRVCVDGLRRKGFAVDVVGVTYSRGLAPKFLKYLWFGLRANWLLVRRRYDCVYLHHPLQALILCGPVCRWRGVRLVLNFHGDDLLPARRHGKWMQRIARPHYAFAWRILVPSRYFKEVYKKKFDLADAQFVEVFPSGGVASRYFSHDPPSVATRGRTLLFLSRLVDGKGWRDFIDVVAGLNQDLPVRAVLAGHGPDAASAVDAIGRAGLENHVALSTATTIDMNRELYASSRYFIFPSKLPESLALVNLEAMACGCIVLARHFPAAEEYISNGVNGFLIKDANFVQGCIGVIQALEADPGVMEEISERARTSVQRYSEESVLGALPSLLGLSGCE